MFDIAHFSLADMTKCGADLRKMGIGSNSLETVADKIVKYLYNKFESKFTQEKNFTLVRLFKTHPYNLLKHRSQNFVKDIIGKEPESLDLKCLTLMSTIGSKQDWNSKETSKGHQAIPLVNEETVKQIPMIKNLIKQFGLKISDILTSKIDTNIFIDKQQKTYNVFHIPDALGSEYIPSQKDFVIPEKVKSCLGFGGLLPSGELFTIIIFSRIHISHNTATMFKPLSLNVKLALIPFEKKVFT